MNRKTLSERDICTQCITPALAAAGWDFSTQVREEVSFTAGRIIVRGKLHSRGSRKRADYLLYFKPNLPIAVIEAKDNQHGLGDGMQCAGPTFQRLRQRTAVLGVTRIGPSVGDPALATLSNAAPGTTVYYQATYRDANPTFCTSATLNITNAQRVDW